MQGMNIQRILYFICSALSNNPGSSQVPLSRNIENVDSD